MSAGRRLSVRGASGVIGSTGVSDAPGDGIVIVIVLLVLPS